MIFSDYSTGITFFSAIYYCRVIICTLFGIFSTFGKDLITEIIAFKIPNIPIDKKEGNHHHHYHHHHYHHHHYHHHCRSILYKLG